MSDEATVVRKRSRRSRDEKAPSPEEIAGNAMTDPAARTDARMHMLPCAVCGQFPGECVDAYDGQPHTYTEPTPLLQMTTEPLILRGPDLPAEDDQVHVWRHVEVPATFLGGTATRIVAYVPGDIITREEAYRVGLLVDLRKDPAEPPAPAPPAPPPLSYELDLDAAGARPYVPPRGAWAV